MNFGLILMIFTNGFSDFTHIHWLILLYIISVFISISPFGEFVLVFLAGGRNIKRTDMKIKIIPLVELVYDKAKKEAPNMVKSVNIKVIYDSFPNAYAIGRKTICVTSGLFNLTDEEIMGILAHEFGHIANRHSELQLIIGGLNIFVIVFLFMLKVFSNLIVAICTILAVNSRNGFIAFIIFIFGVISAKMIWLWIKVCNLFMKTSIRANEYVADKFAYKIGYGKSLAMALDNINFDIASENGFIQALNSTHPNTNERIARLQSMGVNYNAYSL